jgi:hypothetical protein
MVPTPCKNNRNDKELENNLLIICRYLNIVKDQRKFYGKSKFSQLYTEYEKNVGYFHWTLNEMEIFTCIKGE